jgi:hypothetical protein
MYQGQSVFSQVLSFLSHNKFRQCVNRYGGNYRTRSFTCYDQLVCMAFAQLTYRESLRDIECCLRAVRQKLYHMGIRGKVSKSTLADANEKRDWRIYSDYVDDDFGLELEETVYALDSSTIDLCLSVFPWARFRKTKAAVKLHTLLDLRGDIPSFIWITDGKVHDINVLDHLIPEAGAIYIMDRAYLDFQRLYQLHQHSAIFITRSKTNTGLHRIYSNKVDKSTNVKYDQIVVPKGFYSKKDYPEKLRRIKYYDTEKDRSFIFLTNQFILPPETIAELYRYRWRVEIFFKWIKQHLRIKSFYGTSENAVKTQIWIAVSTYVLVGIMKKRLKIDLTLYTILQILSISLFERMSILQALTADDYTNTITSDHIQLKLFDS